MTSHDTKQTSFFMLFHRRRRRRRHCYHQSARMHSKNPICTLILLLATISGVLQIIQTATTPVEAQISSTATQDQMTSAIFSNKSATPTTNLEMKLPLSTRIWATIACVVIFAVGFCGNLLVPIVVIKTKYLRNSTNLFLINLSVADLWVLIVCMPTVLIELHSKPETWLLGESMCKLTNFVEMLSHNGSILTILAISFERYYAICKPLKAGYKCTRLRAIVIIRIIWLVTFILTAPILMIAKSSETVYIDGSMVYNCILETDSYWPKMYVFVSMFAFFFLPLLVLMFVYYLIGRRLVREDLAMSAATTTTTTTLTTNESEYHSNNSSCLEPPNSRHKIARKRFSLHKGASLKSLSSFLSVLHANQYYHNFYGYNSEAKSTTSSAMAGQTPQAGHNDDDYQMRPRLVQSCRAVSLDVPPSCRLDDDDDDDQEALSRQDQIAAGHWWLRLVGSVKRLGLRKDSGGQLGPKKATDTPSGHIAHSRSSDDLRSSSCRVTKRELNPKSGQLSASRQSKLFATRDDGRRGRQDNLIDNTNISREDHRTSLDEHDILADTLQSSHRNFLPRRFKWTKSFSVSSTASSTHTNWSNLASDSSRATSRYNSIIQHHPGAQRAIVREDSSGGASGAGYARVKADHIRFAQSSTPLSDSGNITCSSVSNCSPSPSSSKSSSPDSMLHKSRQTPGTGADLLLDKHNEASSRDPNHAYVIEETLNGEDGDDNDDETNMDLASNPNNTICCHRGNNPICSPPAPGGDKLMTGAILTAAQGQEPIVVVGAKCDKAAHRAGSVEAGCAGRGFDSMASEANLSMAQKQSMIQCDHHQLQLHNHQMVDRKSPFKRGLEQTHHYFQFNLRRSHIGDNSGAKRSGSQPAVCGRHSHPNVPISELLVVQHLSKKQQMDSRRQVVIMLAFVVACFFLLFLPYRVFTLWLILSTEDQVQSLGMETYYNLTYVSRILIYLHSAINPIAYNLISTKFRRAFISILLCRGSATRRHFTATNENRIINHRRNPSEDRCSSRRQTASGTEQLLAK